MVELSGVDGDQLVPSQVTVDAHSASTSPFISRSLPANLPIAKEPVDPVAPQAYNLNVMDVLNTFCNSGITDKSICVCAVPFPRSTLKLIIVPISIKFVPSKLYLHKKLSGPVVDLLKLTSKELKETLYPETAEILNSK